MYTCFGEILLTADAIAPTYYQMFTPEENMVLRAVRSFVIQYNNPTYTDFLLKLYSNNAGVPRAVIASSTNSWTKAAAFASNNSGVKEFYFDFDDVMLRGGETYHLALQATGYTGSDSSHLAWKHSFPDPAYAQGVDKSYEGLLTSPYDIVLIGALQ